MVACDLFATPSVATAEVRRDVASYSGLGRDSFLRNWHRFHDGPPEIVCGPSNSLHEREWVRSVRFIHVDGGHTYDVVRADIALTRSLLCPGGIVVFDDLFHAYVPGVAAAVWAAVADEGLVPFAYTAKLYAAWDAETAEAAGRVVENDFLVREHHLGDYRLLQVVEPPVQYSAARRWFSRQRRSLRRHLKSSTWRPRQRHRRASARRQASGSKAARADLKMSDSRSNP